MCVLWEKYLRRPKDQRTVLEFILWLTGLSPPTSNTRSATVGRRLSSLNLSHQCGLPCVRGLGSLLVSVIAR